MRSFIISSASTTAFTSSSQASSTPYPHEPSSAPITSQTQTITPSPSTSTTAYPLSTSFSNSSSFFNVNDDSPLSTRAKNQINLTIQNSWANSTMKQYSGAIQQFILFCDKEHIPQHLRFPADEFVLCAFAASSIGKHSGSTPRSRISTLKAWHIAQNLEWRGSLRLHYVLDIVHNLDPGSSKDPPRLPINAKMLTQLIDNLDLNSPFDAAVAACAATAFWGQVQLCKLLPHSLSSSLSTPLPTRSDFKRSVHNPFSCLIHLPHTHQHGQDIVLVDQHAPINPISLLENHICINNIPKDHTLFSYLSTNGSPLLILTKTIFLQHCNTIWKFLGYPHTSSHCFRIGGTAELLIMGTPPEVVKATGCWTSEFFFRYWRSHDDIAPQQFRNLPSPIR